MTPVAVAELRVEAIYKAHVLLRHTCRPSTQVMLSRIYLDGNTSSHGMEFGRMSKPSIAEQIAAVEARGGYSGSDCECRSCSAIRAAVESLRACQWRPVETAPTDSTLFLTYGATGVFLARGDIMATARRLGPPTHLSMSHVTHWRPMPVPPDDGKGA